MFRDRIDAGQQLAVRLKDHLSAMPKGIVLGVPRGGVVVAAEVAKAFGWPLAPLVVKKIGAPANPEYAIGAVGPAGQAVYTPQADLYPPEARDQALAVAEVSMADYQQKFGRVAEPLKLADRTVVIVDDGIATGQSISLALAWVAKQGPNQTVLAVPVAPADLVDQLKRQADEVVILETPADFQAIGQWYEDFTQTTDQEVVALLRELA